MTPYAYYQGEMIERLQRSVENYQCQPILFVGTGMSMRYIGAPSWHALLERMAAINPRLKDYNYYRQNYTTIETGEVFAKEFTEWAWSEGKPQFHSDLFDSNQNPQVYLKFKVAEHIREIGHDLDLDKYSNEIASLRKVNPYSIITTNYDLCLEKIFPEYNVVIGEQTIKNNNFSIADIYKIHGCITDYSSLVLTHTDYDVFMKKRRYLSAKLLTYFIEHPVIFLGYSVTDSNIKAILSDIDEVINDEDGFVSNIFLVKYNPSIDESKEYSKIETIDLDSNKRIRVNLIEASNFSWIYDALSFNSPMEPVDPKLLRAILSRTYKMVRTDIPLRKIEINFETLESALKDEDGLAKLYGIGDVTDSINMRYPYTYTQLREALSLTSWGLEQIFKKIKLEKGVDIKTSDNKYHQCIVTGKVGRNRKYSELTLNLFNDILKQKPYAVLL